MSMSLLGELRTFGTHDSGVVHGVRQRSFTDREMDQLQPGVRLPASEFPASLDDAKLKRSSGFEVVANILAVKYSEVCCRRTVFIPASPAGWNIDRMFIGVPSSRKEIRRNPKLRKNSAVNHKVPILPEVLGLMENHERWSLPAARIQPIDMHQDGGGSLKKTSVLYGDQRGQHTKPRR
ncbi:hypothetical protein B0H19DRAFT_1069017 [Mycena capillaripes]|nr:hypothetical protein B0H19DRAFT_1069017 [Mycena capillaripes]